jgi:exodeoxyribonuclease-3
MRLILAPSTGGTHQLGRVKCWIKKQYLSKSTRLLGFFCRTDYHLATPALAALARTEHIYKDEKFSDHAPITVDYDFTL